MNTRDLIADLCNMPALQAELDRIMGQAPNTSKSETLEGQDAPLSPEHSSGSAPYVGQHDEE